MHVITGLEEGGAEAVLYRLCGGSPDLSHEVVSLMSEGKYGHRLRSIGVGVHTLGQSRGRFTPAALTQLASIVRRLSPDVIQTWMYHADLVGGVVGRFAAGRPVCWNVRNSGTALEPSSSSTRRVARMCASLSRWIPTRIVSCAHEAAAAHAAIGYDASKFVVIPNGVDAAAFRPDPETGRTWRSRHGVESTMPLIGMVARFDPQKDHRNLFEALRLVRASERPFRCALVGAGMTATNPSLASLVKSADVENRVLLLGPTDDVPGFMNAIDVHVLSSLGEAFPNVVAEAMASGTPNVVTDVGDAARIVGDTGWVAPRSDPAAFAQAVGRALDALEDGSSWPARQASARARAEREYSLERMVLRYRELWAEVVRR
ncbi:MAG: glycosyltransferase [Thioalkalivibrio sp.]|nr:glycosyltransferase [Thioalkalivibrio sp.]